MDRLVIVAIVAVSSFYWETCKAKETTILEHFPEWKAMVQRLTSVEALRGRVNSLEALRGRVNSLEAQVRSLKANVNNRHLTAQGCQSGSRNLGYGWGRGKTNSYNVRFYPAFSETPAVTTGLTHLDATTNENIRIDTEVYRLSRTGFEMYFKSWDDSVTYEAKLSWMACPKNIKLS